MACFWPLQGYKARRVNPSGKRSIVFSPSEGFSDLPVTVPCGHCIGCRLEKRRNWAVRCMHEAAMHEENAFVTLTYSDDRLPSDGSLRPREFQLFMKRLRKAFAPKRIRFFHAGEYGDDGDRPHYHALLFGVDFGDKYLWRYSKGEPVWRSDQLEEIWTQGFSEIGSVSYRSAAYVARYTLKKVVGDEEMVEAHYRGVDRATGELVKRHPEYALMSRRPGIGRAWLEQYGREVYRRDAVLVSGKEVKPPRYYDEVMRLSAEELMDAVKRARQRARKPEEEEYERVRAKEAVTLAQVNLKRR